MPSEPARTAPARWVGAALLVWLALAVAVGLSGVYRGVPAPVVGATNLGLVTLCGLALGFSKPVRAWALRVPLRGTILFHLVRFVGVAFLVLYARGVIPGAFALGAGWGDIAVAVLAIPVAVWAVPVTTRARWWTLLAWNAFGLADILLVLGNGFRLGLADYANMAWITTFPWTLLPTFIVPLVIVTHGVIFWRLARLRRDLVTWRGAPGASGVRARGRS